MISPTKKKKNLSGAGYQETKLPQPWENVLSALLTQTWFVHAESFRRRKKRSLGECSWQ